MSPTRRKFVGTVTAASVFGIAGCAGGDGDGDDTPAATATDTQTSTATATATEMATETPTDTPTETATETPTATATETSTATPTATELAFESVEEGVTQTNEIIDRLNNGDPSISTINDGTTDYDDVGPMDTVAPAEASNAEEASAESERLLNEADRVATEAITKVVAVINAAAGFEYISTETDTPEEAREQADSIESTTQEGANFLRDGATVSEIASEELAPAAEALGNL